MEAPWLLPLPTPGTHNAVQTHEEITPYTVVCLQAIVAPIMPHRSSHNGGVGASHEHAN
jgi:hypothetical protein